MPSIPNSQDERLVREQGFPYTSTNRLDPNALLVQHTHTDNNTHRIVQGEITFSVTPSQREGLRPRTVGTFHPGQNFNVAPNQTYGGRAGPEGVTFVEGRELPSPTFQTRAYENNGQH